MNVDSARRGVGAAPAFGCRSPPVGGAAARLRIAREACSPRHRRSVAAACPPASRRCSTHRPDAARLESTLAWLREPGHDLVAWGDPDYPAPLLEIGDPPPVLYCIGRRELLARPAFAIVGSRNATPQGCADAEAFGAAMSAAGLAIVSGLALGIDAAAHRGGLTGAGSSIAVIGTGPDRVYPARNRDPRARARGARTRHLRIRRRHAAAETEFPASQPARERSRPRRARRGGDAFFRIAHHRAPRRRARTRGLRAAGIDSFAVFEGRAPAHSRRREARRNGAGHPG